MKVTEVYLCPRKELNLMRNIYTGIICFACLNTFIGNPAWKLKM
jgi:hypothetical protein